MNTPGRNFQDLLLLQTLIAGLGLLLGDQVGAQTFTTLHYFSALSHSTNSDGANPRAGLVLSTNTLFGAARDGGRVGNGTVFSVNTDGTGFKTLHNFTAGGTLVLQASGHFMLFYTNSEGAYPEAGLVSSGDMLYGTTTIGGASGNGTVFGISSDGTYFVNLHNFSPTFYTDGFGFYYNYTNEGANPYAELILSSNTLYGTASGGGSSDNGTVFAVNTDGGGFTNLYSFKERNYNGANGSYTNRDGAAPYGGLVLSSNTLYGTASIGGAWDNGTVFAVNTDGTWFTNLHSFTGGTDGASPYASLVVLGSTLYGTAFGGGSSGNGTVFAVNTDGTGFTNLHCFAGGTDGANPYAGLVLSGNTLYGTALGGGSSGNGIVFAVRINGTGFTVLHSLATYYDGAGPHAGLILSGRTLYGSTTSGSSGSANGTVFSLFVPPELTMIRVGPNVLLSWATNAVGFTLQSTTNLDSPGSWAAVSQGPVVVDGQNMVTNPVSGPGKFYRLIQ